MNEAKSEWADGYNEAVKDCARFLEHEADANFMPNEPIKVLLKGFAVALRLFKADHAPTQERNKCGGAPMTPNLSTKGAGGEGGER